MPIFRLSPVQVPRGRPAVRAERAPEDVRLSNQSTGLERTGATEREREATLQSEANLPPRELTFPSSSSAFRSKDRCSRDVPLQEPEVGGGKVRQREGTKRNMLLLFPSFVVLLITFLNE